jgi:hypothetical protein
VSISDAERLRRLRVMHGWAFRSLTAEQVAAIRAYLDAGLSRRATRRRTLPSRCR